MIPAGAQWGVKHADGTTWTDERGIMLLLHSFGYGENSQPNGTLIPPWPGEHYVTREYRHDFTAYTSYPDNSIAERRT